MEPDDATAPARRLLVLGTSGAFGGGFGEQQGKYWPEQVREQLAERFGDVELDLRRFYVHAGRPWERLEQALEGTPPEFIVIQCTAFPATQRTVAHRVERILGKRAGDWTEARVRGIDRQTRRKGPVRRTVNRVGHRVARSTLGTAPIISLSALIAGYVRAIDRVAMVETASIAVIGTGFASESARKNNPKVEQFKKRFDAEISAAAKRKRLHWVDSAAITRESDDPEAMFLDQLHKGQPWHDGIAKGVVAALTEH